MFLVLGRQGEPDELEQSEDQERSDENTSRSENSEVRKKKVWRIQYRIRSGLI